MTIDKTEQSSNNSAEFAAQLANYAKRPDGLTHLLGKPKYREVVAEMRKLGNVYAVDLLFPDGSEIKSVAYYGATDTEQIDALTAFAFRRGRPAA